MAGEASTTSASRKSSKSSSVGAVVATGAGSCGCAAISSCFSMGAGGFYASLMVYGASVEMGSCWSALSGTSTLTMSC